MAPTDNPNQRQQHQQRDVIGCCALACRTCMLSWLGRPSTILSAIGHLANDSQSSVLSASGRLAMAPPSCCSVRCCGETKSINRTAAASGKVCSVLPSLPCPGLWAVCGSCGGGGCCNLAAAGGILSTAGAGSTVPTEENCLLGSVARSWQQQASACWCATQSIVEGY